MKEPLIDMRVWRQFVAVAEELHFGRAAQRLHITQPPLTQAIAQLEKTLGVVLFDRTRRRVALAPAGEALLPDVRELLARAQKLPARARAAAQGEVGRVRLAFVSTVGFELLPGWVRAFRAQCPQVALDLVEATGDAQLRMLEGGDIDAGLLLHTPDQTPPGLSHLRVFTEPFVLALPEHHPLAESPTLAWEAVLPEPLVIFPRRIAPSLHDAVYGIYHAAGKLPVVAQEAIQMQTIVNLVSAGIGVAWVPESVMQFRRSGVVYRTPVAPPRRRQAAAQVPVCDTGMVWREEGVTPALGRFLEFVRQATGNPG
jgi:DNA-binding transcriptional LysR family regulator